MRVSVSVLQDYHPTAWPTGHTGSFDSAQLYETFRASVAKTKFSYGTRLGTGSSFYPLQGPEADHPVEFSKSNTRQAAGLHRQGSDQHKEAEEPDPGRG